MADGKLQGLLRDGREPGRRRRRTARLQRKGLRELDWLVVRDLRARPRRPSSGAARPRSSAAKCARRTSGPRSSSSRPPRTPRRTAPSPTRSACSSGTTRRSSRPATRAASSGSCLHLGRRLQELYARLDAPRRTGRVQRADLGLPDEGRARGARRRGGAAGDQRLHGGDGEPVPRLHRARATTARPRAAAGSTRAATRTA